MRPGEGALALMEDKSVGSRTAHQLYLQDHLQRVHNEIESTTRKLELEKRRLNKLDEDVNRMRQEHTQKVVMRRNAEKEDKKTDTRKIEHRLAKAIQQLNGLCHDNQDLRARIDTSRRERLQMNQVFKKLASDIKENISTVSQIQRETDRARLEHEERQHRIAALKKKLESERKLFKKSVQELQEQMRLSELAELAQKVEKRKNDDDKKNKTQSLKADEEDNFNTLSVMRKILKLAFLNTIQRRHIKQHQKNIEVFEQAFATIKSTTGISDIGEIVKIFIILEQRNFSLLNYVNALNSEIEAFEKQNKELEDQMRNRKESEQDNSMRRGQAISDLSQQIVSTQKATEENQMQAREHEEILKRCKPLIQMMLKTVELENRHFGGQPAPETTGENMLAWLTYVEKTLTQWKDFLPDSKDSKHKQPSKIYKYTVGNQVLALAPKKHQNAPVSLVRATELPSAAAAFSVEAGGAARGAIAGREDDSSDEEEDLQSHPWNRQELREKALASVMKRKKHRKVDPNAQSAGAETQHAELETSNPTEKGAIGKDAGGELGYEELVEKKDAESDSLGSDSSDLDEDVGPTDEEINEIFLKRYKMSKEELQGMADKMGIQLNNLCYLKQEFDAYDEDRSGYIDAKELKGLLEKLGEELSDEELDQAFRELDSDNSGEIEFFEFVEWFTSED